MNGWAGWVLAASEAPLFVLIFCVISAWQRRQSVAAQREQGCSVAAIAARIEQEQADEATAWLIDNPEATLER